MGAFTLPFFIRFMIRSNNLKSLNVHFKWTLFAYAYILKSPDQILVSKCVTHQVREQVFFNAYTMFPYN